MLRPRQLLVLRTNLVELSHHPVVATNLLKVEVEAEVALLRAAPATKKGF